MLIFLEGSTVSEFIDLRELFGLPKVDKRRVLVQFSFFQQGNDAVSVYVTNWTCKFFQGAHSCCLAREKVETTKSSRFGSQQQV